MRQIDFDQKYKGKKPEEIIEAEVTASLKKVVSIRERGRKEENQLRAAFKLIDKFVPDKQKQDINLTGDLTVEIVQFGGKDAKKANHQGGAKGAGNGAEGKPERKADAEGG